MQHMLLVHTVVICSTEAEEKVDLNGELHNYLNYPIAIYITRKVLWITEKYEQLFSKLQTKSDYN